MSGRPALLVGVGGHRVLAEIGRVAAGVDDALDGLATAFPGRPLSVVSALAEGSDRVVVQRAFLRQGCTLVAILPLPRDDYERDFPSAASKEEFRRLLAKAVEVVEPAAALPREAAYERAGLAVLDRSDVLLAVWDGQPSQGRGGTADIVAEARSRGLPLVWIHAGNRTPGTLEPSSLGPAQGLVTWERVQV